jgi:hypothetical protein
MTEASAAGARCGSRGPRAYCIESFGSVDGVVLDPAPIRYRGPDIGRLRLRFLLPQDRDDLLWRNQLCFIVRPAIPPSLQQLRLTSRRQSQPRWASSASLQFFTVTLTAPRSIGCPWRHLCGRLHDCDRSPASWRITAGFIIGRAGKHFGSVVMRLAGGLAPVAGAQAM